nr:hypothetical protein [Occallatibacter savannae]
MEDVVPSFNQDSADKKPAVAMSWIFFAAHDCDPEFSHSTFQSVDSGGEFDI